MQQRRISGRKGILMVAAVQQGSQVTCVLPRRKGVMGIKEIRDETRDGVRDEARNNR